MNRERVKKILLFSFSIIILLTLSACTAGYRTPDNPAGFLLGIWHGWIAPFVIIASIFIDGLQIYEVNNVGFLYNVGFYMAIISGFGSLGLSRRRRK